MTLQIKENVLNLLLAHARREEPNEACGYLASKNNVIIKHFELSNIDAAPDHYTMDPTEQFTTIGQIRKEGMQLAAVYHSHPETPARPSVEDIRLANDPNMVYIIVSLMAGVEPIKAFSIKQQTVTNIPLRVLKS